MPDPTDPITEVLGAELGELGEQEDDDQDEDPENVATPLGAPFAIAHDADLLDRDDAQGVPGCYASIQCSCGELFRANLLDGRIKRCPACKSAYTHVLLWAKCDDTEIADAFLDCVLGDEDDRNGAELDEHEPEQPHRTIRSAE